MLLSIFDKNVGQFSGLGIAAVYFSVILIFVIATKLIVMFLNNKSKKFITWFIFSLSVFGFVFHFFKVFFPPYTLMDNMWRKLTFENICAVSVLLYPFVYFTKSKAIKDYMVTIGMMGGIAAILIPGLIMNNRLFSFEVFRFYFVHYLVYLIPYLMLKFKIHTVNVKRSFNVPIITMLVLTIIFLNELAITYIGWVPRDQLFDPTKRNPSIIFGLGGLNYHMPEIVHKLKIILTIFTPNFLMDVSFLPHGSYFPVLWLLGPVLVYGVAANVLISYMYDKQFTKQWFAKLFRRSNIEEEDAEI